MSKGLLVVLSAPSGCGKDTVFKALKSRRDDVVESVSATTRHPRPNEKDGVNYFFLSEKEFVQMINEDGLLEYAQYNNNYYGTPVKGVENAINEGKICFLIIEVQGAQRVMKLYPDCVSIFLLPPSEEVLEKRLHGRETDTEEMIKERLEISRVELGFKDKYTYNVVNDDLDDCVDEIEKILDEELLKRNSL